MLSRAALISGLCVMAAVTSGVRGQTANCPWDCGDPLDEQVGIVDFLTLLAQWGAPGACDFDGDGVGITDFLELLAHWGPCPTGACCFADGTCTDLSLEDCVAASGFFHGVGTDCSSADCFPCPDPSMTDENEPDCGMPVDTVNGGCNLDPPLFTSIACGEEICASSGAAGLKDFDWYVIELTDPGPITWEVTPEFPAVIGMVEYEPGFEGSGNCDDLSGASNPILSVSAGQTGSVTTICLPAGTYYLFVVPPNGVDIPCGAQYRAMATCQVGCLGACCLADGTCSEESPEDCATAGGFYNGDGTDCSGVDCFPCPDPSKTDENEPDCGMPVDTVNGGCNLDPPLFTSIECGEEICASTGAVAGGPKDFDWYVIELTDPGPITWEVTPDFPAVIGMVEYEPEFQGSGNCDDLSGASNPALSVSAGQTGSVTTICLPAGTYYLFVVPPNGVDIACGAQYRAMATCQVGCLGACCFNDGTCSEESPEDCAAAGGFYHGDDTDCLSVDCFPCADPSNTDENEPDCGMPVDTVNGGCVLNPPLFTSIACGDEICGTSGAVGGQLDFDVFAIELTAPGRINWEVTPDFPAKIGMVEYQTEFQGSGDCDDMTGASNPIVSVSAGQTGSVTTICLPVGTYYLFVVPQSGADFPCGAQYRAKASCQAGCAGACCFANLSCSSVVTQTLCQFFGGFFGGEGTSCAPPCGSPQAGNCCVANCTASCQDADCCQAVCSIDPFCCINSWDAICVIRTGNFPAQCGCP